MTENKDTSVELYKTTPLMGKRLAFCVGGGIASIEACKVIRELRRMGASVKVYATAMALEFITTTSLEWSSSQAVITGFTGLADHIAQEDGLVVFPVTANLMAKYAHGIGDCVVSTLYQSAVGQKKPVILFPAMHGSLHNQNYEENASKVSQSATIITPQYAEGKYKSRPVREVALEIAHCLNSYWQTSKPLPCIAITMGGVHAPLDPLRAVTNYSTGSLGLTLLEDAYGLGFAVQAFVGVLQENKLPHLEHISYTHVPTFDGFQSALTDLERSPVGAIFHLAAVSDYAPTQVNLGKINSDLSSLDIHMVPTEKLIERASLQKIPFRMGCKLTYNETQSGLDRALGYLNKLNFSAILWNDLSEISGPAHHKAVICYHSSSGILQYAVNTKAEISCKLLELFMGEQ